MPWTFEKKKMRIFIISDIHIDFAANRKWLRQISKDDYKNDVLLLAGDVCHDYDRLCSFLTELKKIFFRSNLMILL